MFIDAMMKTSTISTPLVNRWNRQSKKLGTLLPLAMGRRFCYTFFLSTHNLHIQVT